MKLKTLGQLESERLTEKENNFLLIRLFASLLVVAGHSLGLSYQGTQENLASITFLGIRPHSLGVLIFFCISGFLITSSILKKRNLKEYLTARSLRILPGLSVCVLLTVVLFGILISDAGFIDYITHKETISYIASNISLTSAKFSLPFVDLGKYGINGSLWTIPIEARLYIYIAIFYTTGLLGSRPVIAITATATLTALYFDKLPLIPYSKDNVHLVCCFFIGSLMYIFRENIYICKYILFTITAISIAIAIQTGFMLAIFFTIAYACLLFAYSEKIILPSFVQDYSYGVYLYSFPIQQLTIHYFPNIPAIYLAAISIPVSIAVGAASWFAIEKPFLSLKRGMTSRSDAIETS
ncbi:MULTISPECIES: acyltransferase [Pseudomonas]|uniref:acyltransferase family protein n=1 Tax=Pseudomonas TaxID=286 RepID=UPI0009DCF6E4|nr:MULTISPECIES: acyltransferase [Pseudomonas]MBH3433673.1 acyltransferase [Pseudomonas citronellolis]